MTRRTSSGFVLYTRYVNIIFDRGIVRDWYFNILVGYRKPPFNKGAGYIGGATFFLAWNCVDKQSMYRPRRFFGIPLQIGITRNANAVPWTRH